MKKLFTLVMLFIGIATVSAQTDYDPVADSAAVIKSGNMRFTVLTPQMIRIQYSPQKKFEDRATFGVVNRKLPVPEFTTKTVNGYLYIITEALTLKYKVGTIPYAALKNSTRLSITFKMNGENVLWYPGKDDALNLKGTSRTLDNCIGDSKREELENGLISRAGWAIIDESPATKRGDGSTSFAFDNNVNGVPWVADQVDPKAYDWYFLGYGHDYKKAISDYITKIGGRIPMPPLYILGYWYSKYQRYSQQDFINLAREIESNNIPIDVMIFDMDWHLDGWTGWTWNKELIPDPEGLIRYMHNHKLKVSLNLHPADGVASYEEPFSGMCKDLGLNDSTTTSIPWALDDSAFYKSFSNRFMRVRENQGVDFWWLDWQQTLTKQLGNGYLGHTFWLNHVFYNDMKAKYSNKRPVIFHRWGGLGSHRYPIGFSGDTHPTFGTLAYEPYFTATASNVGFGYWGHDLGGHNYNEKTNNSPELYLRWMQYGVFSPLFRTHGSNYYLIERRIWKYSNFPQLLETVNLRYALMPYIYTAARETYDTGISMCRPLYYDSPEENNAYRYEDEYMFGNDILVAPVVSAAGSDGMATRKVWLPEGKWFDVCRNRVIEGATEFSDSYTQPEIPYFLKAGSILVNNCHLSNLKSPADTLIINVAPGADGSFNLYEDEGDTEAYKDGVFATTLFEQQRTSSSITVKINPREGSYPGMQDARCYTVKILAEEKPEGVLLNGEAISDEEWSYDEMSKCVVINTGKVSCSALTTVSINRNVTSINKVQNSAIGIKYDANNDRINVDFGKTCKKARLVVYNTSGQEEASAKVTNAKTHSINLSKLQHGTYICRVNADGNVIAMKILK